MGDLEARAATWLDRNWRLVVLLSWVGACIWLLFQRWGAIHWFSLPDTDDNMRIMQVRALLNGQAWYDLRQYRMDPPLGANIHWSRIVDLPIAGIMLLLRPLIGGALAEKIAVAAAPLIPMALALFSIGLAARRVISPAAYPLALALLLFAHGAVFMWSPLRIDHHGWQLALLSLVVLSFTDQQRRRGGMILGLASAACLSIGLEMFVYLAVAGAIIVFLWILDAEERSRLACYGVTLAGGTAFGYLAFASYDNRLAVCDALSPVWLSVMLVAGAMAVALAALPLRSPALRLLASLVAAGLLAAGFAYAWPQCLGRPEHVSADVETLWLSKVREARPIYVNDWNVIAIAAALPVAGLFGYLILLWVSRTDEGKRRMWACLAALAIAADAMLLWQTRAGPAAQLLAVPGAAGLAYLVLRWFISGGNLLVRAVGVVVAFLFVSGLGLQLLTGMIPNKKAVRMKPVSQANRACPTLAALHPIALQPKGLIFTFVDLGPRIITVTHHDVIAGPYHRNGDAIMDVIKTFRGSVANAEDVMIRHQVDYVLICPNMSESTVYKVETPKGFYSQLATGQIPKWLTPVKLPDDSPYVMWKVGRAYSTLMEASGSSGKVRWRGEQRSRVADATRKQSTLPAGFSGRPRSGGRLSTQAGVPRRSQ